MRPLLILISLMVTICHGRPGGSYRYPVPTPPAPPALLSNLGIPSSLRPSIFNLQSPTASLAPQVFLPSPDEPLTPSVINLSAPSIPPSLLVENVIGAGQYSQPLTQPLGLQSFGQPLVDRSFSLAFPHLQLALPFANQGLGFEQPGFNFGGSLPSVGLPQPQPSFGLPQLSTPAPAVSFSSAQSNVGTVGPTSPSVEVPGPSIIASQEVEVQKHVYVHVAPEQPRAKPPPRRIVLPPPRKHYRIIFIKAPSAPEQEAPLILPQVQDEEKTLVYVLVKKPEEQPEIKIKPAPPTPPTKPEVYFINYDTRRESIEGILRESIEKGTGGIPIIQETSNDPTVPTVRIGVPESIEEGTGSIPITEETSNEPTVPTVRIGGPDLHKNVDLNLNKASLTGGSALSLSVTGSPVEKTLHVSSTPPPKEYGAPEEK